MAFAALGGMDRFVPIVDQIRRETAQQRRDLGESKFESLYVQSLSKRLEEVVTEYAQGLIASCTVLQEIVEVNPVLAEEILRNLKAVAPRMREIECLELVERMLVAVRAYRQLVEMCDGDPIRQRELSTVVVFYKMMIEGITPEPAELEHARAVVAYAKAAIVRAIQEAKDPELMKRRRDMKSEFVHANVISHKDQLALEMAVTPIRKVGMSSPESWCPVTVVKTSESLITENMSDCVTIVVMLGYDSNTCSYAERRMLHVLGGHLASYHPSGMRSLFQGLKDDDKILVAFGDLWKPEDYTAGMYTQIIANAMEKHGLPTPKDKQFDQVFTEGGIMVRSNGTYMVFHC